MARHLKDGLAGLKRKHRKEKKGPAKSALLKDIVTITQALYLKIENLCDEADAMESYNDVPVQLFRNLTISVLSSLTLFNCRRSGEVHKMTVEDFKINRTTEDGRI